MNTCTRRFEFDSCHRVLGISNKCRHIHGHRYVAEVTINTPDLDSLGMVIDFGVLKDVMNTFILESLDHNAILNKDDPSLHYFENYEERKPYIMKYGNPTAENIAREIFEKAEELLPKEMIVVNVRVYETPNCYADYTKG